MPGARRPTPPLTHLRTGGARLPATPKHSLRSVLRPLEEPSRDGVTQRKRTGRKWGTAPPARALFGSLPGQRSLAGRGTGRPEKVPARGLTRGRGIRALSSGQWGPARGGLSSCTVSSGTRLLPSFHPDPHSVTFAPRPVSAKSPGGCLRFRGELARPRPEPTARAHAPGASACPGATSPPRVSSTPTVDAPGAGFQLTVRPHPQARVCARHGGVLGAPG